MLEPKVRLSQGELKRRYALVREKMAVSGLDLLLVSGIRFVGSTGYLRYLTNWAEPFAGESLVFPREAEPVFCARTGERAYLVEHLLGLKAVNGSTANVVARVLKERGAKRIGICGLQTMLADFYVNLTKEIPNIQIEESSKLLDEVRMVKSDEELGWVKQSAHLGDIALQMVSSLAQEGRTESEVFIEIDNTVKRFGAENTYYMMSADPHPVPKFIDMAYERYQKGDLILFNAEIAGPGGYFTQIMRTLSLGKPSKEADMAFAACKLSIEAGESLLKPGKRTVEVFKAIVSTIEKTGHHMGLHPGHSQGLDIFERPLINKDDDVELKAGMVIVLHPHVLIPSGGGVLIGDTFIITPEGCQRLHKSSRELQIL